jgi:hypothetical protein
LAGEQRKGGCWTATNYFVQENAIKRTKEWQKQTHYHTLIHNTKIRARALSLSLSLSRTHTFTRKFSEAFYKNKICTHSIS